MKEITCRVIERKEIAKDVFSLLLDGGAQMDFSNLLPGQFVNLTIDGFYLRRPISVCDVEDGKLLLIFKILGTGTKALAERMADRPVTLLSPLGNGFQILKSAHPVLVGGGVGVPPLYYLAKRMLQEGMKPKVAFGFASEQDVFYEEEFRALGLQVGVATVDGSYGKEGFVTRILQEDFPDTDYVYCCGPIPMLRAIHGMDIPGGQYSFEERMGCGFGACMGCSWKMKSGYKRVCKEGPVFLAEDILW